MSQPLPTAAADDGAPLQSPPPSGVATAFVAGMLRSLPFLIVVAPFGMILGVTAAKAGLSLLQVAGFSTIVLAGASQITAIQLIVEQAPLPIIILSALAVNLRMAMYSAALVPWLGKASGRVRALIAYALIDQTFAIALKQFEENRRMSLHQRAAFFFGSSAVLAMTWPLFTVLGAALGQAIPPRFALDFAVPITFLAMVAPMLRSVPHLAAAVTGVILAAVLSGLPNGLGLMIAAPIAMMVGAELERRQMRRKQAAAGL